MGTQNRAADNARMDEVADRVRELNERILASGHQTGVAFLDIYEKALHGIADMQVELGERSEVEWLSDLARLQAQFTRELANAYTSAVRDMAATFTAAARGVVLAEDEE
jgi:hypothetical protein